ncbi:dihydrolipoyl dehydrogenase [Roseiterribacter gracilis]|uniref:Dihydrolipoyl dehydrogenase n=1 Tax=Roseiterribacter gracilis TaxID=2812848 RepID=A0A8S8XCU4_9PROT|nr:dihydrolipoyl dehydrogenase [Rhodospirillales bacterium TMPK1]
MAETLKPKVLVVGGGPGGYVAAIRAGQFGLDTILVEGDKLGGTCLIRGCIPSKAVIHAASNFETMTKAVKGHHGITLAAAPQLDFAKTVAWKEEIVGKLNSGVTALLKRAKVKVVHGWAKFSDGKTCTVDTKDGPVTITADNVILANGSLPVELRSLPFGGNVISSTEALSLPTLPNKLVVVGGGYIGLELGIAFRKLGAEVTIVEAQDRILPIYDAALVEPVKKWLEKNGVKILLGAKASGVENGALVVETKDGKKETLPADKILVTIGRKPNTQGWGLENMAVDLDGAFVKVDGECRTSMRGVYAIGDLVGEPMLAHKASAQGEMVAEIIAGKRRKFEPVAIPAICFTEPEVVSVGLLPTDKGAEGALTANFPFQANGRALTMDAGDEGGFVRVVARKDDHRILGIQAVGLHVSELSGEFVHALEMGAVLEDIAGTIHAHPTLGEAFHEATLRALGHAIHV